MDCSVLYSKNDTSFAIKPLDKEYELLRFTKQKTDISELIDHLCSGKSITTSVFKNDHRNNESFFTQQAFGVDFDNTLSLAEVDRILLDYGLNYNFGHYTLRHTKEKPRFRIFFVLDGEVRDAKLAKDVNKAFYELFNQKSDKNAQDVSRIWLGTNKGKFDGDLHKKISIYTILELANQKIFARDRNQRRSLLPIEKVDNINCAEMNKPIMYIYKSIQICTEAINNDLIENTNELKQIPNCKPEDFFECKIFKTFYDGLGTPTLGNKLIHNELLGIASNLIRFVGGEKIYKECIEKNKDYSKEKLSFISYLKNNPYQPIRFVKFSPFEEDRENEFQTLPELVKKRGKVKILDKSKVIEYISETEASQCLKDAYNYIQSADTNKIYLLKAAAGLGKTELFKNTKGIVMAFPDNALKDEQFQSSKLKANEKLITPSFNGMFNKDLTLQVEQMYATGQNEKVIKLITEIASSLIGNYDRFYLNEKDISNAKKYIDEVDKATNSNETTTVFTTHTRAIFTKYPQKTIVFDEDPLKYLFNNGKVSLADLKKFSNALGGSVALENIINNSIENVCLETPILIREKEKSEAISIGVKFQTNILKFFESHLYLKEGDYIHYRINNLKRIPTDKKIVIADATASELLYKNFFGDRLEIIDISNVKYKGKIHQYIRRSCSKTGLRTYNQSISDEVGEKICITFKAHKKDFKNPCKEMHFGRLRGSNELTGKSFAVVGTFHQNNLDYKFLAAVCKLVITNFKMNTQRVQYRNKEFSFQTFDDPILRQIHLESVEGELIQAVNRARLIRNDVIVYLYSNLPLDQATYIFSV
jgi:hypothetical protein